MTLIFIFLHSKNVFLYKNFAIEDGPIFVTQSLQYGIKSLFITYAGYNHLILRLIALISSVFPLSMLPVVYLFFNILFRFFVVVALYYAFDLENVKYGVLIALMPLLAPVEADVYDNLPNLQWFLAFLFVLVLSRDWTKWNKYFTAVSVSLLSLTGPFSILFFPIAVLRMFVFKDLKAQMLAYFAYFTGMFVQLYCVLNSERTDIADNIISRIPPFLHNFVLCFSHIKFISVIIFLIFLFALYKFIRNFNLKNDFKLISLIYAGVIIVFSSMIAISKLSETYIPGRYLFVYATAVLLFIILTLKNKYITLLIILFTTISFTTVSRRDIYWDQYLKYLEFNRKIFVLINPILINNQFIEFGVTLENNHPIERKPDALLHGLEYFKPAEICSSEYAAVTILYDKQLTTSISTKDNSFYDTIVLRSVDKGLYKSDYIFPVTDSDYIISVVPDLEIKLYCLY